MQMTLQLIQVQSFVQNITEKTTKTLNFIFFKQIFCCILSCRFWTFDQRV